MEVNRLFNRLENWKSRNGSSDQSMLNFIHKYSNHISSLKIVNQLEVKKLLDLMCTISEVLASKGDSRLIYGTVIQAFNRNYDLVVEEISNRNGSYDRFLLNIAKAYKDIGREEKAIDIISLKSHGFLGEMGMEILEESKLKMIFKKRTLINIPFFFLSLLALIVMVFQIEVNPDGKDEIIVLFFVFMILVGGIREFVFRRIVNQRYHIKIPLKITVYEWLSSILLLVIYFVSTSWIAIGLIVLNSVYFHNLLKQRVKQN